MPQATCTMSLAARSPATCRPVTCWWPTMPPPCPPAFAACTCRGGRPIELRLAGRRSLAVDDVREFTAIAFGEGDHRTPTEHRAAPPPLHPGDVLQLGPAARDRAAHAGAPQARGRAPGRHARRDLGRHRAPRQADPVRAPERAACAVGRVDGRGGAAGGLRAAVGRLRAGLGPAGAAARGAASSSPR